MYHVVCHDCTHEFVTANGPFAKRATERHKQTHGHNVEFAGVDD